MMELAFPKSGKRKKIKFKSVSPQRERRKWIDACLDLWGKLVRNRDVYCQKHGTACRKKLTAHHIVSRGLTQSNKMAWFDLNNGVTLCWRYHDYIKTDPDEYIKWRDMWLRQRGLSYDVMRTRYGMTTKVTSDDLKLIYNDLKWLCLCRRIEVK